MYYVCTMNISRVMITVTRYNKNYFNFKFKVNQLHAIYIFYVLLTYKTCKRVKVIAKLCKIIFKFVLAIYLANLAKFNSGTTQKLSPYCLPNLDSHILLLADLVFFSLKILQFLLQFSNDNDQSFILLVQRHDTNIGIFWNNSYIQVFGLFIFIRAVSLIIRPIKTAEDIAKMDN